MLAEAVRDGLRQEIKIDKAFVRDVDRSASDAAIANAILSLGESLGITVTAEGWSASSCSRRKNRRRHRGGGGAD